MKLKEEIEQFAAEFSKDDSIKKELKEYYALDQDRAWQKIEKRNRRGFTLIKRFAVATASVAAACILFYVGFEGQLLKKDAIVSNKIERADNGKPYIITASGDKIELNDSIKDGVVGYNNVDKLIKHIAASEISATALNRIVVPKGETLKVELSDGTLVWLNSNSTLLYPSAFDVKHREVQITGEAYFEVISDQDRPFIVKSNNIDVRVTGTKFNVSDYDEDSDAVVTLLEGIVAVKVDESYDKLVPSDQFNYNKATKEIVKTKVNTMAFVSWTKDKIFLKDMPLRDIAVIVDRWFSVEIECSSSDIENETFTGEIYRYDTPEDIVNFITKAAKLNWKPNGKGKVIIY